MHLAFPNAELPRLSLFAIGYQSDYGLARLADDDLLASIRKLDKLGEPAFGLVDVGFSHGLSLAKSLENFNSTVIQVVFTAY